MGTFRSTLIKHRIMAQSNDNFVKLSFFSAGKQSYYILSHYNFMMNQTFPN